MFTKLCQNVTHIGSECRYLYADDATYLRGAFLGIESDADIGRVYALKSGIYRYVSASGNNETMVTTDEIACPVN